MKNRFLLFIKRVAGHVEPSHPIIIPVAIGVIILIILNARNYYNFSQEDPGFCDLCHVMEEPHNQWRVSAHKDIPCQQCHSMNLLSQNRLMLSYLTASKTSEIKHDHGLEKPWETCKACHLDSVRQGGVTLRKSYGHARHVFMEKIDCRECHTGEMHNFTPDQEKCLNCHADKGVHGLGMEGFACLTCHAYGDETIMPRSDKCLTCHAGEIPPSAPMNSLQCQSCHHPHTRVEPTVEDCRKCHINQDRVGSHAQHGEISCMHCHKAHGWRVGPQQAETLCAECHRYRDPMVFIF